MDALGHVHPLGYGSYNKDADGDLSFSRRKKPPLAKKVARIFDSIPFPSNSEAMNLNGKCRINREASERSAVKRPLEESFIGECQQLEREFEEIDKEYWMRLEELEELKSNLQEMGKRLEGATARSWHSHPDLTSQILLKVLDQKLMYDNGKNFIERFYFSSQKFLRKLNHYLDFIASHDFKDVEKFATEDRLETSPCVEYLISPCLTIEMQLMIEEMLSCLEDVYENLEEESGRGQISSKILKAERDIFKNHQNSLKKIEADWVLFIIQLKKYCLSVCEFKQFEKDFADHLQKLLKRLNQAEQMHSI